MRPHDLSPEEIASFRRWYEYMKERNAFDRKAIEFGGKIPLTPWPFINLNLTPPNVERHVNLNIDPPEVDRVRATQ